MTITPFAFVPPNGLRDASYAPTDPPNEAALRQVMQGIPDQLKDYINTVLLPTLASTTASSSGAREIGSETIAPLSGNTVYAQLVSLVAYINSISIGAVPNDSITNDKLAPEVKAEVTQNTRKLKNWIINGGFDVWQRGTSQTTSGYGSDDRWSNDANLSSFVHSRQSFAYGQTDVPNNPTYFSRTIVTSVNNADSYSIKRQNIEDVSKFSGKTISVSFYAKADSPKNMSIEFVQNFGSGGSATIFEIGVTKIALTSTWTKYTVTATIPSVSGKTIGANNYFRLQFWFEAGSTNDSRTNSLGNQSGTFDIANVSLVEGSIAQEWQNETYSDVLIQCQRYYIKFGGSLYTRFFNYVWESATSAYGIVRLPQIIRIFPTLAYSGAIATLNGSPGTLAIDNNQTTNLSIVIGWLNGSGGTAGTSGYFRAQNDVNAFIAFDAEL